MHAPLSDPGGIPHCTAAGRGECCLPDAVEAVGSPPQNPISGLHHAACILAPPGSVLGSLLRTQGSLPACQRALAGWDFPAVFCRGTHWVTLTGFIELVPIPPSRVLLGATTV